MGESSPLTPSALERRRSTRVQREFTTGEITTKFASNRITTAKYNAVTFLPKNLWEQFHKLANCYFLIIAIMQVIPQISISEGQPVILLPLVVVLGISGVKDAIEDSKRKKSDREENYKECLAFRGGTFESTLWKELVVGDIVKVVEDEYFPADILLLQSSEPTGLCYVETKSLDGETNLKHKAVQRDISAYTHAIEYGAVRLHVTCQPPNDKIYEFNGNVNIPEYEVLNVGNKLNSNKKRNPKKVGIGIDQFLLRGSSMKNTQYIIGLVVSTGHETKIMLNSTGAKAKRSRIERGMNQQIVYIFLLQMLLCFFSGIFYASWVGANKDDTKYLAWRNTAEDENFAVILLIQVGTWMLIFTNFVPISLLVTLEVVKFAQAFFIGWDEDIYHYENALPTKVHSSNLNEELGQINYVFSDKTGTLTCNIMEFKKLCVNGETYGSEEPSELNPAEAQGISNVSFFDTHFWSHVKDPSHSNHEKLVTLVELLGLCHTILVQTKEGKLVYQASSPDELALVNAARYMGIEFQGTTIDGISTVNRFGKSTDYELLNILEFTSARKRMSVIIRDSNKKIKLLCKGADTIILRRLANPNDKTVLRTLQRLEEYAVEGLRTLLCAEKEISEAEYLEWNKEYQKAYESVFDRDRKVEEVSEKIEQGLEMVGATAIEDKLQDHVPETIASMREAGIRVWVLTGDKIETALNIGMSCALLSKTMHEIIIDGTTEAAVIKAINAAEPQLKANPESALILSGDALIHALKPNLSPRLMHIARQCPAVMCCRVSPKQKALVVKMVKEQLPKATTLSIGDGANDVNMITEAHIGVGISGLEGQQATRAADYAIGQFSFLHKLLFVHGREAYRRNAMLVCYNFYKNVLFVAPQWWFGWMSSFSGQPLYDPWIYQLYNVVFTSLPIFLYAIFDREFKTPEVLMTETRFYRIGLKSMLFNAKVFWKWVAYGGLQALAICMTGVFTFAVTGKSDGHQDGLWAAGAYMYAAVVILATIELLMFTFTFFWFTFVATIGSIVLYYITLLVLSSFSNLELTGLNGPFLENVMSWFALILLVGVAVMIRIALMRYRDLKSAEEADMMRRSLPDMYKINFDGNGKTAFQNLDDSKVELVDGQVSRRTSSFAFSQEAGHTPQLMSASRGRKLTISPTSGRLNKKGRPRVGTVPYGKLMQSFDEESAVVHSFDSFEKRMRSGHPSLVRKSSGSEGGLPRDMENLNGGNPNDGSL